MELRMYGFVAYNLSSIQKGIQFGHAAIEYNLLMDEIKFESKIKEEFYKWRNTYKTFIILDGGTTNLGNSGYKGSLNLLKEQIEQMVPVASFYEPDLGDQLSAFVFICDERVFNKEKYPDIDISESFMEDFYNKKNSSNFWKNLLEKEELQKIESLRDILKNKKLAI